jgi:hypothetical protein
MGEKVHMPGAQAGCLKGQRQLRFLRVERLIKHGVPQGSGGLVCEREEHGSLL